MTTFDPATAYATMALRWFALFQHRTVAAVATDARFGSFLDVEPGDPGLTELLSAYLTAMESEAADAVSASTGAPVEAILAALRVDRERTLLQMRAGAAIVAAEDVIRDGGGDALLARELEELTAEAAELRASEASVATVTRMAERARREIRIRDRGEEPRQGTAAHARWVGVGLGLDGEALALFVRGGAPARREARIVAARDALLAEGRRIVGPHVHESGAMAAAIVIGMLDGIGLGGGRGGFLQPGTARVPALVGLGKGRRHADDGQAWSSAIKAAVYRLAAEPSPRGAVLVGASPRDDADLRVDLDGTVYDVTLPAEYRPWLRQLAERALLRLGGREAQPEEAVGCVRLSFEASDAVAWAVLLEASAPAEPTGPDRW